MNNESVATEYMLGHVFDGIRVISGTVESYIQISKQLNLPSAFLEHIREQLKLLLAEKLIT